MINHYISLKKKDQSLYFIKKPTVFRNWNCFVFVLSFDMLFRIIWNIVPVI